MVLALVLCAVILVTILKPAFSHSLNEGYFIYHSSTKDKASVISDNILTTKVRRRIICAELCVRTLKCNSYFYRYPSGDCVLHTKMIDLKGSKTRTDWLYLKRRTPYEADKTPIVMMFAIHARNIPYCLNLNTLEWKIYDLGKSHKQFIRQKGSGFYDKLTRSLITADKTTSEPILSTPINSFEDIEDPKPRVIAKEGFGISFDSVKRRIFFLKEGRDINIVSLKGKKVKKYQTLYGGKFIATCRTVYCEKRKMVYTYFPDKHTLNGVTDKRKRKKWDLSSSIVNLEIDVTGDRLIYLSDYTKLWEIPLSTMKPKVLMGTKVYSAVFPLDKFLLVSVPNEGGYSLHSKDGKRLIKKIKVIEQCEYKIGTCEETLMVRMDL